ncbi:recombination-associated protein RdgC [Piscinibacter koreensis]|uniref:Recombination-associated protein RdgC n=1 Tax=Piscinibacter koreensis TaxID=2742824 RepID=A0A7Y6NPT8_9BURK|nr:recombination-associated protein RdgC [Schlegelella koreensis]NUZ07004.1 recombination-associated protein RdgC [Schlegelella koreensis]
MFKNALVYRIDAWDAPTHEYLEERMDRARFLECTPTQPLSTGWVPPRADRHAALLESVGGQLILKLCTETKAVPGAVIKEQLDARLAQIESETGRRPKGKNAIRELKEQIVHELLPRAFPKRSTTLVWIDRENALVVIGASSLKKADAVVTQLLDAFDTLRLSPLQTALAPATAMSAWLSEKEAPPRFSVDRDCELKQPDSEKAVVRYARHTLDIDEVGGHIREGKLPTQLAMTWNSRVSFVLTDALTLKKISLLDVVVEKSSLKDGGDDGFDADVAITTGELQHMLPDLIDALGGPVMQEAAADATSTAELPPLERLAA